MRYLIHEPGRGEVLVTRAEYILWLRGNARRWREDGFAWTADPDFADLIEIWANRLEQEVES